MIGWLEMYAHPEARHELVMRWRKLLCPALTGTLAVGVVSMQLLSAQGSAPESDPKELVASVIQNEMAAQVKEAQDGRLWSYKQLTRKGGKETLVEYCQTKHGTIHRLLEVNGKPLSPSERQAEERRIQKLIASPRALQAAQRKEAADGEEERKFLKLFPKAFMYKQQERQGDRVTLSFTPDPSFRASGIEEQVLHSLAGTMVVDAKQKRLVSVKGRTLNRVKFWGGLVGYLNPGGTFAVELENVAPGDWELKALNVDMKGKALLFKSLSVQEYNSYSDYTPVPSSITLAQAAQRLKNHAGA